MYKKVKVVMLPSEEKAIIHSYPKGMLYKSVHPFIQENKEYKSYNLYFISNDGIKKDDWYIDDCNEIRQSVTSDAEYWKVREDYKKIIASTDLSLFLPKVPDSFISKYIEEYNRGNIIQEVMVKYEPDFPVTCNSEGIRNYPNLKINPDNTISVKIFKDSWSRKEVIETIKKAFQDIAFDFNTSLDDKILNQWIEENL